MQPCATPSVGGVGFPEAFQSWWLKQVSLWWDGVTRSDPVYALLVTLAFPLLVTLFYARLIHSLCDEIFQADQICHFRFPWFWGVLCPDGWRCEACVSTNTQWVVAGLIPDLHTSLHHTDLLGNLLLCFSPCKLIVPGQTPLTLPSLRRSTRTARGSLVARILQEVQSHGDVCIAGIATVPFSAEGLGHTLFCMFGQIFLQEGRNWKKTLKEARVEWTAAEIHCPISERAIFLATHG